jgi:hypothetical protein
MYFKHNRTTSAKIMIVAADQSVEQPPTNFYLWNHINQCICIKYVPITFEIIIGVALQQYEEYNNLPH